MTYIIQIISGILMLYAGAEALCRGSAALARRHNIPPLVIGLTIVAYGTSAPEMVVSIRAAMTGYGDIAVGNVVGSNICNIGLILGISAMIHPIRVHVGLIRKDIPVMIAATLLCCVFLLDGKTDRPEGMILLVMLGLFTWITIRRAGGTATHQTAAMPVDIGASMMQRPWMDWIFIFSGLGILILGARILIGGSIRAATLLGISEAFIGLTIVAVGTSLPELATSVVAAWKNQSDMAAGNVIGSNIFNLLGIMGVSSTIHPFSSKSMNAGNLLALSVITMLSLPLMKSGFELKRWEGGILVLIYAIYIFSIWPG